MTITNYNGQQHKVKSPLEIMQDGLEASSFNFYLTGSRVFGKENTDYDYFVEDSIACSKFLQDIGFETLSNYTPHSSIPGVCRVMRWTDSSFQIDIQLVTDAIKKSAIQQKIIAVFGNDVLDYPKRYMTKIWSFGYLLYKDSVPDPYTKNPVIEFEELNVKNQYDVRHKISHAIFKNLHNEVHYNPYNYSLFDCIRNKRIIPLIKFIRQYATNTLNVKMGLKDSKDFVDNNLNQWYDRLSVEYGESAIPINKKG